MLATRTLAAVAGMLLSASCGAPGSGRAASPPASRGPAPQESILPSSPSPVPTESPAAGRPEWLINLRANPQTFNVRRPVALVDIESGQAISTVPSGLLTVAYETAVGGRSYLGDRVLGRTADSERHLEERARGRDAPPGLPASLAGAEWTRLPTTRPVVALTFDAGGDHAGVAAVLDVLSRSGATATFLMTGRWAEVYPADARLIGSRYRAGNHTLTPT